MKTKKNYITPEICEYSILTTAIICQSAVNAGGNSDDDYVNEDDALSSEHRGAWDDIWVYME
ncbi:MAG: hypothetical protein IKJ61_04490 [Bacteroidaceae bacterium]|nr:hypothetical protein [Bacteroidaceae bacterium]